MIAALAALTTTDVAFAETISVKAKSGAATVIGGFFAISREDCYAQAIPPARVKQSPRHGRVEIRQVRGRFSEGFCKGSLGAGLHFIYTPTKGFRGADEVVIDIPWEIYVDAPSASVRTNTYRITVE